MENGNTKAYTSYCVQKYGNIRYFHDSLPYGTGPGTDTDLASVMNGEGNRRFDEVFSVGSA